MPAAESTLDKGWLLILKHRVLDFLDYPMASLRSSHGSRWLLSAQLGLWGEVAAHTLLSHLATPQGDSSACPEGLRIGDTEG